MINKLLLDNVNRIVFSDKQVVIIKMYDTEKFQTLRLQNSLFKLSFWS